MNTHNLDKKFGELSSLVNYKKKSLILHEGATENFVYYIHSGVIAMIANNDGAEICHSFCFENAYFSSYVSFITRTPSVYTIVVLQDALIEKISYDNLQRGYRVSNEHQKNGRLLAEQLYIRESKRTFSLITENAEQRYINFLTVHPNAFQLLPQKYIASYLGITPVSLSRLRRKIAKR